MKNFNGSFSCVGIVSVQEEKKEPYFFNKGIKKSSIFIESFRNFTLEFNKKMWSFKNNKFMETRGSVSIIGIQQNNIVASFAGVAPNILDIQEIIKLLKQYIKEYKK